MLASLVIAVIGCGDHRAPATDLLNVHPQPGDPALDSLLAYYDERYNPDVGLVRDAFSTPGYHSAIPAGSPVHPTRESLIYALALLQRDGEGDAQRAANIIRAVLRLQDTDPASETCGVWPWLLEEPLAEMESPDLNWADFAGRSSCRCWCNIARNYRPICKARCVAACGSRRMRFAGATLAPAIPTSPLSAAACVRPVASY